MAKKFVTGDYVHDFYSCTKFGDICRIKENSSAHHITYSLGLLFFNNTDCQAQPASLAQRARTVGAAMQ